VRTAECRRQAPGPNGPGLGTLDCTFIAPRDLLPSGSDDRRGIENHKKADSSKQWVKSFRGKRNNGGGGWYWYRSTNTFLLIIKYSENMLALFIFYNHKYIQVIFLLLQKIARSASGSESNNRLQEWETWFSTDCGSAVHPERPVS